jgi:hypothetical protein
MNRRDFLALLMATGARFTLPDGLCNAAQKQKKMPNILIIITDDQGYAFCTRRRMSVRRFAVLPGRVGTPGFISSAGTLRPVGAPVCRVRSKRSPSVSGTPVMLQAK